MEYLTTLHPGLVIGTGSFGVVRLCRHDVHGEVAAKFFFKSNFSDEAEWLEACDGALTEARSLRALEHRNVVRIHDAVSKPDKTEFLLVMEFCDQGSARDSCERNIIDLSKAKNIVRDAAMGLNYIHEKGYIHRDIKPDNIFLMSSGDTKVGDFGFVTDDITLGFARPYGTPIYLAPEVRVDRACTHLSDVYSLGVTFIHLTHGDHWLMRSGGGQIFDVDAAGYPFLKDSGLFLPHLPTEWRTAINRLTRAESGRRCASMGEAVNLLSRLPAVEGWECFIEPDLVRWRLPKGGRTVHVLWENYLRRGDKWRAWSDDGSGLKVRTLSQSDPRNTWRQSYRRLQGFFASRNP